MFSHNLRRFIALTGAVVLSLTTGLITAGCSNSSQHKDAKPVVLKSVNHIGGYTLLIKQHSSLQTKLHRRKHTRR